MKLLLLMLLLLLLLLLLLSLFLGYLLVVHEGHVFQQILKLVP